MKARIALIAMCLWLALALSGSSPTPAAAQAVDRVWSTTCVDCPHHFGDLADRSLRFDSSGQAHVVYGGGYTGHLFYAARSDGAWHIEVVDPTRGTGESPYLALAVQGQPHISYRGGGDLRYAYRDEMGWHLETVNSQGRVGLPSAVAVSTEGHVHIAYLDSDANDLKYARRDATGWHLETIDTDNVSAWPISMALDLVGHPHIAYIGPGYPRQLRYATWDGSAWRIELVNQGSQSLLYPSIAVDGQGVVHISCQEAQDYELLYATRVDDGWHMEVVDDGEGVGAGTSLAFDSVGRPHISYWRDESAPGPYEVKYAFLEEAGWQIEVASWGNYGSLGPTSLALNPADAPCLLHLDQDGVGDPKSLQFACKKQGETDGWAVETIDAEGVIGRQTSLAVDSMGQVHMAYTREPGLAYAVGRVLPAGTENQAVQGESEQGWQREVIDDRGTAPSLALGKENTAHLAYIDAESGDLRYGIRGPSGWQIETVDGGASGPSLALSADWEPHIAYTTATGMRIARREGSGWQVEVVAAPGGSEVALALRHGHQPCLATIDGWGVRFAYQAGGVWYSQVIAVAGPEASDVSLAFDSQGIPHVSYLQKRAPYWTYRLKVAHWETGGWQIDDVLGGYGEGNTTALVIDSQDRFHTANFYSSGGITYATLTSSGWQLEHITLYTEPNFEGLALDPQGRSIIAYHDLPTEWLMLLWPGSTAPLGVTAGNQ